MSNNPLLELYTSNTDSNSSHLSFGTNYWGSQTEASKTFLDGATALEMYPPVDSQSLLSSVNVIEGFDTPRTVGATKLTIPTLNNTNGRIHMTSQPAAGNFFSGPVVTGNDVDGSTAFVPFSGTNSAYASSFSDIDNSRITLPEGFLNGVNDLSLGGVMSLEEHLSKTGHAVGAKFQVTTGTTHGTTNTFRSISEITNATGGGATAGYGTGTRAAWAGKIRVRSTVSIDPPLDPELPGSTFLVKAGSKWVGNYTIIDKLTGDWLSNPTVTVSSSGSSNDDGTFLEDWLFDPSKYSIQETINFVGSTNDNLPVLVISAGQTLTNNITILSVLELDDTLDSSLKTDIENGDFELYLSHGTGLGGVLSSDFVDSSRVDITNVVVPTGTDRNLDLFGITTVFSKGCSFPNGLTTNSGMVFENGLVLPATTSFATNMTTVLGSTTSANTAQGRFVFSHCVMSNGFSYENGFGFKGLVSSNSRLDIPDGSVTTQQTSIPWSSSWYSFPLNSADIAAGHTLSSTLTFDSPSAVNSDCKLVTDSVIKSGSILETGTVTSEGMTSTTSSVFSAGAPITSPFDVTVPVTTTSTIDLTAGTIVRSGTVLPSGTDITNGNTVPADLPIGITSGVVLLADSVLNKPILQPGFTFKQFTGFESGSEIPSSSMISANANLPAGTMVPAGSKFPFPFPLPAGFVISSTSLTPSIPAGTVFRNSQRLPKIFARPQQDLSGTRPNSELPYFFVNLNSKSYMVVKSGTFLLNDFFLPKGSVLLDSEDLASVVLSSGVTSFNSSVYTAGDWVVGTNTITVDDAEYSAIGGNDGSGATDITITAGVPTENGINLLNQFVLTGDMAIPLNDNYNILDRITFNVDFTIQTDTKPSVDYLVIDETRVSHPANKELTMAITLSSDFIVPSNFSLNRKITLPVFPDLFIKTILQDSGTFIRFPMSIQNTKKKFYLGVNTPVSSSGTVAGLTLTEGNVVNATLGYITTATAITIISDWKILVDVTGIPHPFTLNGVYLPSGSSLPADITIPSGSSLPAGLPISTGYIQLASDFIVPEVMTLVSGSVLNTGSVFGLGSVIVDGMQARNVTYGPVSNWDNGSEITLNPGSLVPTDLTYNFFFGENVLSLTNNFDIVTMLMTLSMNSSLIAQLRQRIEVLESSSPQQ